MLGTVFFYNFIVLSSTFFVYFSEKCKYRFDRNILLFIALLIIFIPSAIRYNIGTDFPSYIYIYNNMEEYSHIESGFYYLNKLLIALNLDAQWSIASLALIFSYVAALSYPRKEGWVVHLLFFLSLYFFSFNGTRQAIAIAFSLYSYKYFIQKKIITSLFLILIGALFHTSILLLIPVFLICLIPLPDIFKLRILPIFFILIITFIAFLPSVVINLMELITLKLNLKYHIYFSNTRHFIPTELGTGLGLYARILFCSTIIIMAPYLLKNKKKYWSIIVLNFIYTISVILTKEIVIFGRLEKVFSIAPIIGAYALYQLKLNIPISKTLSILFIVFMILAFTKESFGIKSSYNDPMLNPYQTIFSSYEKK